MRDALVLVHADAPQLLGGLLDDLPEPLQNTGVLQVYNEGDELDDERSLLAVQDILLADGRRLDFLEVHFFAEGLESLIEEGHRDLADLHAVLLDRLFVRKFRDDVLDRLEDKLGEVKAVQVKLAEDISELEGLLELELVVVARNDQEFQVEHIDEIADSLTDLDLLDEGLEDDLDGDVRVLLEDGDEVAHDEFAQIYVGVVFDEREGEFLIDDGGVHVFLGGEMVQEFEHEIEGVQFQD